MSRLLFALLMVAGVGLHAAAASAQEFRIYTRLYAEGLPGGRTEVLARSLSLFHGGKVYDLVETGSERELIVFEPAHNRFTVLNPSRSLATSVHFDELNHRLKLAANMVETYIAQIQEQHPPDAAETIDALRFSLAPTFQESFDGAQNRLTLAHPFFTYRVTCAKPESPETAAAYLRYADWTARLNYALHPQAPYPGPRLAMNDALRRRQEIPVEVELESRITSFGKLRAQHQIHWQLDAKDRSLIHDWETTLQSDKTRHVTFQEYQKTMLGDAAEAKR